MTQFIGRSSIQIAEDLLLETATPVFNISIQLAVSLQHQRKEIGMYERLQAEFLLNMWEATHTQIKQAHELAMVKKFAISRLY